MPRRCRRGPAPRGPSSSGWPAGCWRRPPPRSATGRRPRPVLVLDWLETFPGGDWQDRWILSGSDEQGSGWGPSGVSPGRRARFTVGAGRAAGVAGRPPVLPLAVRQSNARRLRPLPATQPDRDVRPAPPAADRTRRLRRVHRRRAEPGDPNGHRDRQGRARSRPRRRHRLRPGPPRQWATGGRVAAGLPGAARRGRVDRTHRRRWRSRAPRAS